MLENVMRELNHVVITDRDVEIFRFLNEEKFMVASQIYETFWPMSEISAGTARQRLTKLVNAGYIKTRDIQKDKIEKLRLFLLTEKGISVLKGKGFDHGFSEIETLNECTVAHTLKLATIRMVFKSMGYPNWRSERLIRKEDSHREFYPDAILQVKRFKIAIELENSFREKEKYITRFAKYVRLSEFELVIYILSWTMVKAWLLDIEVPQNRFGFVLYDDLLNKRKLAQLVNKTSRLSLGSILG